jgi:NAD(P)-dependent dehydrogenase (short-subunit alcohol dehydrogenase family)
MPRLAPVTSATGRDDTSPMPIDSTLPGMGNVRFDGRVAIVTGAGRGLGREHALLLGARGATVVVNDARRQYADEVVEAIRTAGGEAIADDHPIGPTGAAHDLVALTLDTYGRLDIVLNNAGLGGPTGTIDVTNDEQVTTIVETHMLGSYRMARAAWPHLVAAGYGRILFTSSGGSMGTAQMSAYAMAKAGLWGLTRALAIEGADHGIRVNALMPIGYTRAAALNPHEDTRRWMEDNFPPRLCAPAACFLVHEDVPCSGEFVSTGAGRVARMTTVAVPGLDAGPALTLETVRDRWSEVMAMEGSRVVMSGRDELAFYQGPTAFRG